MPRLSLWKKTKSHDYLFLDSNIREQFYVGGVGLYIYKYLGPKIVDGKESSIQDFLLLENRDRKYDKDIYELRGHYQPNNIDFDLSQFGLFLQNDTVFITFHYNDMIERLGRKLVPGDVIEVPNLVDDYPLDLAIPISLKKFYVITDTARASEGFSQTWWPHLWRAKCVPLMDSQEYADIFGDGTTADDLKNYLSSYKKLLEINEEVIAEAEANVPESGYDTSAFFVAGVDTNDRASLSIKPKANGYLEGYLTGDGQAPNGITSGFGTSFPGTASEGDFFLRTDYMPNRLFRYSGVRWVKFEDDVRMTLTNTDERATQRAGFTNNTNKVKTNTGLQDSRQALSELLKLKND
jgi:hypothetical protein